MKIFPVIVIGSILVVGVIIGIGIYVYIKRLKRAFMIERSQKIKFQRSELAMSLRVKEKDNLVRQIDSVLGDVSRGKTLTAETLARLQSAIRSDSMAGTEGLRFAETFANLHPCFLTNLHKRYPGVGRTSQRLACFLIIGMDTRQIARVMNIRPESVRQARWRLRSQMGLAVDKSLEEALMELL